MITKLQITGKLHYHRKCDFQLSKRKLGYRTLLPLTAPIDRKYNLWFTSAWTAEHQRGTFYFARWQRDYSPDLCWISTTVGRPQPASFVVLGDFPHSQHRPSVIHIGLQLPIIRGVQRRRWNWNTHWRVSISPAHPTSKPLIAYRETSTHYQHINSRAVKLTR